MPSATFDVVSYWVHIVQQDNVGASRVLSLFGPSQLGSIAECSAGVVRRCCCAA
jgi:hypothetical protein